MPIHLKFLGHISRSMGSEEMELARERISIDDLFALLLGERPAAGAPTKTAVADHGFSKFNTLLVVNGSEAFSASAQIGRYLVDGDSVLLVPFSHGG
jgi:hypothetical protein